MTVRLLQVGLGEWGRDWATNVLPIAEGVEVTAAVDPDLAAIDLAKDAGVLAGADIFPSLHDALVHSDVDAVLITAAIKAHTAVAVEALNAGLHVLVEKPMTPTLAEAESIVELATARGLVLAVVQNFRYYAPVLLAAELVRDATLGAVRSASVDFRRFHPFDDTRSPAPELDHSILIQIAIHHFDTMRAVLGQEPVRIYCRTWNPPPSTSIAPAAASAVVEFSDGAIVTYRASVAGTGEETPWCGDWRMECARGDIVWAGPHYPIVDGRWQYDLRDPGYLEIHRRGGTPERQALTAMLGDRLLVVEAFVDAIQTGADLPISGRNNLTSIAMMEAALTSARTGVPVAVPVPRTAAAPGRHPAR